MSLKGVPSTVWSLLCEAVSWLYRTTKLVIKLMTISLIVAVGVFTGSVGAGYVWRQPTLKITETVVITSVNVMDVNAPVIVIPPPTPSKSVPDFSKPGPAREV